MRRRLAVLLTAVAVLATPVALAQSAPTHQARPATATKTCGAGYTLAPLSWGAKCLRAGEFCKVGNREYLRYGYVCPATRHLRRR